MRKAMRGVIAYDCREFIASRKSALQLNHKPENLATLQHKFYPQTICPRPNNDGTQLDALHHLTKPIINKSNSQRSGAKGEGGKGEPIRRQEAVGRRQKADGSRQTVVGRRQTAAMIISDFRFRDFAN